MFTDMDTGIRCFSDLVSMLKELNRRELEVVTLAYLKDKRQSARLLLVDALGTAGTTASYHMMRSHVFLPAKPDADLLLRALFQLSSAVESPPPVCSNTSVITKFPNLFITIYQL